MRAPEREMERLQGLVRAALPGLIRNCAPGLMRELQQESRSMRAMLCNLGLPPRRLESMRAAPSRLS